MVILKFFLRLLKTIYVRAIVLTLMIAIVPNAWAVLDYLAAVSQNPYPLLNPMDKGVVDQLSKASSRVMNLPPEDAQPLWARQLYQIRNNADTFYDDRSRTSSYYRQFYDLRIKTEEAP